MTLHKTEKKSVRLNGEKNRSTKTLSASTVALINAVMLAGAAHAQTTNAPPDSANSTNAPAKLPDVIVTGEQEHSYKPDLLESPKYTEPLRDVPQTITVIPQAVMEEQNATTLRDVLRNVPGISIQAGEGGVPAGDNLSIRGFNARTDLFIDGVRDFGGYARDPFNFEQVEVAKGPASSYAGRGSTGGSVNLVSKVPQLNPFYAGSVGFGTDEYERFTIDLNQPIKQETIPGMALRLNGMWNESGVANRDVTENERWGVAPSITLGLGTPTRATFSYFHLDQDNVPDYGIPWVTPNNVSPQLQNYINEAPPVDFSNFYGLKHRDYEKVRTDLATAVVEHDFNDSFRVRNLFRFGRTHRDSIITAPRFFDTDPTTNSVAETTLIRRSDWKSRDQVSDIIANQTDFTYDFNTGPIGYTLVSGIEYDRETDVNYARVKTGPDSPNTDLFHPNPDDPYTENIRHDGARAQATADTVALYAFDTIKLTDQWQLTGGLRWDHFDLDFKNVPPDGSGGATTKLSRTDEMLSWRVGAVYKPLPNGSIYAAYGTSFNPSAEGLTLDTRPDRASFFKVDPEETQTYEIGTKWDLFENRLALSAAIFRTEKTNARTEDPADSSDIIVLDGEQRVDGFEIGAAGRITKEWNVFAGYTLLLSEITKSKDPAEKGNELSNTPQQTFSLWTTYDLPWNFQIGGGAQFIDSRFSNFENTREAPSYVLFDATAAYNVNENISLRLNVYNLADEKYIDRLSGGHFIPGAGRSATLTANFKF